MVKLKRLELLSGHACEVDNQKQNGGHNVFAVPAITSSTLLLALCKAIALQACCNDNLCNLSEKKNEFEHFLYYVRVTGADNMRSNVPANFVNVGLQFSDILLSRDMKSYGRSPGIRKHFVVASISSSRAFVIMGLTISRTSQT